MVPTGKQVPRILSPEDLRAILEKCRETDLYLCRYIVFCLWTGAWHSEAKGLLRQNIDWSQGMYRLTGKGNRERIVLLIPQFIEALSPVKRYIGPVFALEHADT